MKNKIQALFLLARVRLIDQNTPTATIHISSNMALQMGNNVSYVMDAGELSCI